MKKGCLLIMLLVMMPWISAQANTKKDVSFKKCTDGDTAHFLVDGIDTTVRFLAIDTPEYTKEKEPYGKEASAFTCNAIQNAKVITLEYDDGSEKTDKYGRALAWVYVDGELLQEQLVREGLAEVAYLYGDYAYTDELYRAQDYAKQQQKNIWSEGSQDVPVLAYAGTAVGVILILILSFSKTKGKKRKINRVKKAMKQLNQR